MTDLRKEILTWPEETAKLDRERILSQEKPSGVIVEREHWYDEDGSPWHSFEICRPAGGATEKGTVIEIHGGAWIYGNKELNENHTMYFASRGWNAVSLSYRLQRDVTLPETVHDIVSFLTCISDGREALGLDLSRVLLTGDSAGAHLASLTYAVLHDDEMMRLYGIDARPDFEIDGLGLSHPVMNLEPLGAMGDTPLRDALISEEILRMMTGLEDYKASPIYGSMSFTDFADRIAWPPIFVITSLADGWHVNTAESLRRMDGLGMTYELLEYPMREDLGHVFHVLHWFRKESREANDALLSWFRKI